MRNQIRQWGQKFILACLAICCMTLAILPEALAASLSFTEQKTTVNIQSDGSIDYRQDLWLDIETMNGFYFNWAKEAGVDLTDYRLGLVVADQEAPLWLTENYSEDPETFQLIESADSYQFKIFYPTEEEELHFVLEYKTTHAITSYLDTAEFNHRLVDEAPNRMKFSAQIYLPAKVSRAEDFRAWGHGSPSGQVALKEDGQKAYVDLQVADLKRGEFVESQILFPLSLVPNNQRLVKENKKEAIIQAQEAQVEADRKAYQRSQTARCLIALVLVGLGWLFFAFAVYYYRKKKADLDPHQVVLPEHIYELPAEITPAIMATSTFRTSPTVDDFSATILDLVRKGYIELEEVAPGGLRLNRKKTVIQLRRLKEDYLSLERHERAVMDYLFSGQEEAWVRLDDLEKRIKQSKSFRKERYAYWEQFKHHTEVKGEQRIKKAKSTRCAAMSLAFMASVFGAIAHVVAYRLSNQRAFLYLLVGLVLAAIFVLYQQERKPIETHEESLNRQEWTGFANMLKNVGNMRMREVASLALWEEFLVYAVSLGVADKVIKEMNRQYAISDMAQRPVLAAYGPNPHLYSTGFNQAVRKTIDASLPVSQKGSFTGTNTGGFGGGFSGGSSGGGGGSSMGGF